MSLGSDYKNKTRGQKQLRAHQLEEENKRREEEEALAREMLYGEKRGLTWPPEDNKEEWEADRQYWVNEAFKSCNKVFKPMPDKPPLNTPPPIDRKAARDKASKIVAETDAFGEYEKRQDDINPQETVE